MNKNYLFYSDKELTKAGIEIASLMIKIDKVRKKRSAKK